MEIKSMKYEIVKKKKKKNLKKIPNKINSNKKNKNQFFFLKIKDG